ncbi:MAG: hypothetical protein M3T96_03495 [Acidobacteriota bacterium]|nr:hypothetical protein [Acidobacteriota bacterium]
MKKVFLIFAALILAACTGSPPAENTGANTERIAAKNKQTAVVNEVTLVMQTAQKLEKEGRAMEIYRNSVKAASLRECDTVAADEVKQAQDLAERITKLPNPYQTTLLPVTNDLGDCVSCSKTAMASCVKTRAAVNQAIKQLYP